MHNTLIINAFYYSKGLSVLQYPMHDYVLSVHECYTSSIQHTSIPNQYHPIAGYKNVTQHRHCVAHSDVAKCSSLKDGWEAFLMFLAVTVNKVSNLLCQCKLYASKIGGNEEMLRSVQHNIIGGGRGLMAHV